MPNGVFPVPKFHSNPTHPTNPRQGIALRLRTRWKRPGLDRELSRGADPGESPELTIRAAELRSPAERWRLAERLRERLDDARAPDTFTLKLRPHRAEIRDCADDLLALIRRLRDEWPIEVRGAAMTAWLLTDKESPLDRASGAPLCPAVRAARVALDPSQPTEAGLPRAA
jgi:hypothetical protein